MKKILEGVFVFCLLLFFISGALLVVGQLAGVIIQSGEIITFSHNTFSKPAFVISAVAGVIAYILNIIQKRSSANERKTDDENQII